MSGDKFVKSREQAIECFASLQQAVYEAGGSPLSVEKAKSISLMEFITTIAAQNGIRFQFEKPKEEVKHEESQHPITLRNPYAPATGAVFANPASIAINNAGHSFAHIIKGKDNA